MNVHQLSHNYLLVHLSLAKCKVRTLSNFTLGNLRSLDLSDNLLTEVSVLHLTHMPELSVFFLVGNPLTSVFTVSTRSTIVHRELTVFDLSRTMMSSVNYNLFHVFANLHTLNLSHSGVELLQWNSSQMPMAGLREVDLRGCKIEEFPRDVLRGFLNLQLLYADNFKLCCPSVLPPDFDQNNCRVTPNEVSTCDNLLGSVTYRATVAVLASLALIGNIASLTIRVCVRKTWRQSSAGVVLTHLAVADLGTGLYLVTLGLADRFLAGQYVWRDNTWRRGVVCHLAGVLTLSCRQAASFLITLLTLDHCMHCCSTVLLRLTPVKVKVMCAVIWVSSLLLAAVPLTPRWSFFKQQALCVPLPHKRNSSLESHYAYGIMVLLHFVMLVLCSVLEVIRGFSKLMKSIIVNEGPCPKDFGFVLLGSLTSGFLYTIACLVPKDSSTERQTAIHTALVYFGSVVSCALNPYLHLYGVRVQRSKRIKEKRRLRIISRARV